MAAKCSSWRCYPRRYLVTLLTEARGRGITTSGYYAQARRRLRTDRDDEACLSTVGTVTIV